MRLSVPRHPQQESAKRDTASLPSSFFWFFDNFGDGSRIRVPSSSGAIEVRLQTLKNHFSCAVGTGGKSGKGIIAPRLGEEFSILKTQASKKIQDTIKSVCLPLDPRIEAWKLRLTWSLFFGAWSFCNPAGSVGIPSLPPPLLITHIMDKRVRMIAVEVGEQAVGQFVPLKGIP